jgi:predicted GNAT family acetyltransferase
MKIEEIEKENELLFTAKENEDEAGRMYCSWSPNGALVINHTEVHEAFKGTGAGKALVLYAVEYARKRNIKIVPLCRFAKAIIGRDPGMQDVL